MANNLSEVRSKIAEALRSLSDEDLIAYAKELGIEVPVDAGELACETIPTPAIFPEEETQYDFPCCIR